MSDMQRLAVPDALDDGANHSKPLRECVLTALRSYLGAMGDHEIQGLYRLVMDEVEQPMLEAVLEHTKGNQSAAAEILGISRGTLRKKLKNSAD
jgi:Fis family transcriptional regulator